MLTISFSPGKQPGVRISHTENNMTKLDTYVMIPLDPRLELSQAEMNFNAEHDRPVLLSAGTGHGLGARSQWGQISSHETQRREII
jgi:hypothetical protein